MGESVVWSKTRKICVSGTKREKVGVNDKKGSCRGGYYQTERLLEANVWYLSFKRGN